MLGLLARLHNRKNISWIHSRNFTDRGWWSEEQVSPAGLLLLLGGVSPTECFCVIST